MIGIHVSAKTIKNKVAPPFRSVKFEIHFGKGIVEHEQVFDLLRKHGQEEIDGKIVEISGNGSWKSLIVAAANTGEVLVEKKFYKADFDRVMKDPEYSSYVNDLLERALVRKLKSDDPDIDPESYEEVRAVALEVEDSGINVEV